MQIDVWWTDRILLAKRISNGCARAPSANNLDAVKSGAVTADKQRWATTQENANDVAGDVLQHALDHRSESALQQVKRKATQHKSSFDLLLFISIALHNEDDDSCFYYFIFMSVNSFVSHFIHLANISSAKIKIKRRWARARTSLVLQIHHLWLEPKQKSSLDCL